MRFDDLAPKEGLTLAQPLRDLQLAFGYSQEDLRVLMAPMAANGEEPLGSMGNDNALAVLSDQRPRAVLLLQAALRAGHQPADRPDPRVDRHVAGHRRRRRGQPAARPLPSTRASWSWTSRSCATASSRRCARWSTRGSSRTRSTSRGRCRTAPRACTPRLAEICDEAHDAIATGVNILILSDRGIGRRRAPIPSLLAVAAVHHHLVREGTRLQTGLVLESGEPREVHHFATLIGYGASADQPLRRVRDDRRAGRRGPHPRRRVRRRGRAS